MRSRKPIAENSATGIPVSKNEMVEKSATGIPASKNKTVQQGSVGIHTDIEIEIDPKHRLKINDYHLVYRKKDGFVDVTNLCKAGGKKYNDWNRLEKTQAFLRVLNVQRCKRTKTRSIQYR